MGITWLASYPRSGNTWLRFILHHLLYGPPADSAQVAQRIPDAHLASQLRLLESGEAVFGKTHFPLNDKHPLRDRTRAFVFIVRHPKDVLISNTHFHKLANSTSKADLGVVARAFIQYGGLPDWREKGYGTLAQHAASWLDNPIAPHVVIRYEDLHQRPVATLRPVLELIGHSADDAAIEAAFDACKFEKMRAMEVRERVEGKNKKSWVFAGDQAGLRQGRFHIRAARTNQSLAEFGKGLDEQFDRVFHDVMVRFGYAEARPGA